MWSAPRTAASRALTVVRKTYIEAADKDDERVAGWQMENRLAEAQLARDRTERNFELAIQPLRDLRAKSCRTNADHTAFHRRGVIRVLQSISQKRDVP